MEIKTCEQYVLDRLDRAEKDVESLQKSLEIEEVHSDTLYKEVLRLKSFIERNFIKRQDSDGDMYVYCPSLFEKFEDDKEDYDLIAEILDELKGEEKED